MTLETELREDLGLCCGCNEPLRVGEVVTPYDDEVGHANCDNPASFDVSHLADDPDCPAPVILLGSPAKYVALTEIKQIEHRREAAKMQWDQLQCELRQDQACREAARWSNQ